MSQSVIHPVQPKIKRNRVRIDDITLGEYGFLNIENYMPSGMNHFMFALMGSFGLASPHAAVGVTSNGQYIFGPGNATITYMIIDYYYTD